MTLAFPAPGRAQRAAPLSAGWRRALIWLGVSWASILLIFQRDVRGLTDIYWNSTTFGHCLFVPLIFGWLVWLRREQLMRMEPVAWWSALGWVGAGALVWVAGELGGVALVRHVALVMMMQGAVVTLLGPHVARGLIFPLAYMGFLVPFGDFLEPPLQTVTVKMVMALLHLFGVPASVDGVLITIPNGYFEVAEACSGDKFVIAMLAYGTLVANVCYVSWRRRAAFMAMALSVPVLANGVRAFGTIYAAWWTSVEAATGFDHIVYGFVFFALVMAGVIAIGWRWFDRDPSAPWFDPDKLAPPTRRTIDVTSGSGLVIGIAVAAAALGYGLDARAQPLPARIALPDVPGWSRAPLNADTPWVPYYPTADHFLIGRYVDRWGRRVDLAIAVYGGQHEGKELITFGQGAIRENDRWVRVENLPALSGGAAVRMRAGRVERETVSWYRIGNVVTSNPRTVKLETLKAKLFGGPQRAVAVLLSAEREGQDSRAAISDFLAAMGPVDQVADRAAGMDVPR